MRLKLAFEGHNVKPEDIVVVRPDHKVTLFDAKKVWEECKRAFPDNEVLILLPDYELKSYNKEDFLRFWENVKKKIEEGS